MIVVGVDPGARQTGLAVAVVTGAYANGAGVSLLGSTTVTRDDRIADLLEPDERYLALVLGAIRDAVTGHKPDVIAVELVSRPRQHLNGGRARGGKGGAAADPTALMATATVIGAVFGRSWAPADLVRVPPGGNGSRPVGAYPVELRGPRESLHTVGTGQLRHERSAYDVAISGSRLHRLERARR